MGVSRDLHFERFHAINLFLLPPTFRRTSYSATLWVNVRVIF